MFDKKEAVKWTVKFVVGIGAQRVVSQVIENNVNSRGRIDSVFIEGASIAMAWYTAEVLGRYTDRTIDHTYNTWKREIKKK